MVHSYRVEAAYLVEEVSFHSVEQLVVTSLVAMVAAL